MKKIILFLLLTTFFLFAFAFKSKGEVGLGFKQLEEISLIEFSLRGENIRGGLGFGKKCCTYLPFEIALYFTPFEIDFNEEQINAFEIFPGLAGEFFNVTWMDCLGRRHFKTYFNSGVSLLFTFSFNDFPLKTLFTKFDFLLGLTPGMGDSYRLTFGIEF